MLFIISGRPWRSDERCCLCRGHVVLFMFYYFCSIQIDPANPPPLLSIVETPLYFMWSAALFHMVSLQKFVQRSAEEISNFITVFFFLLHFLFWWLQNVWKRRIRVFIYDFYCRCCWNSEINAPLGIFLALNPMGRPPKEMSPPVFSCIGLPNFSPLSKDAKW